MDCSRPGHYLPEFVQTHVHWVTDIILPLKVSFIYLSKSLKSILSNNLS